MKPCPLCSLPITRTNSLHELKTGKFACLTCARKDPKFTGSYGRYLTHNQDRLLAAVKKQPGLTPRDYAALLYPSGFKPGHSTYGYHLDRAHSRLKPTLKGLLEKRKVYLFAACHCGFPLTPHGKHSHKCNACGSLYANVHVKADRIGIL